MQELARRTFAVEHEDWVLFQFLKRDLLLFQVKICRVCNEYVGKIADGLLNVGVIQVRVRKVGHDQIDFSLIEEIHAAKGCRVRHLDRHVWELFVELF